MVWFIVDQATNHKPRTINWKPLSQRKTEADDEWNQFNNAKVRK